MDLEICRSAEVPGQVASARVNAHFQSSELGAHQMSPAGVTPHSSPPGTASEVQTVEVVKGPMVAHELMD